MTSETYMKKLEALAPYGWEHKNLQVVISTEVVKGQLRSTQDRRRIFLVVQVCSAHGP